MKSVNIKDIRPVLGFENDFIINPLGSYSRVYEMNLPEIFSLSQEDYKLCNDQFMQFFKELPDYSVIHKMDIYIKDKYVPKRELPNDTLSINYQAKFNEREFFSHKTYLILSKGSQAIQKQNSLTSLVFKKNIIPKEFTSDINFEEFKSATNRVEALCNDDAALFNIRKLDKNEIWDLCESYENLNFQNQNFTADIYQDSQITKVGNNHITALAINNLRCFPSEYKDHLIDRSFSTDTNSVKLSLFHPIGLGCGENHIVNQVFIKESSEDVKLKMEKDDKMNTLFVLGDPSNKESLDESIAFKLLLGKGHTPIRCHSNVILWDKDKQNLISKENKILGAFKRMDFNPNTAFNEILPLYWSCYPGNASDIGYLDQTFYLVDRMASALNIFETSRKDNISPFGIHLSDRLSGIPLWVDPSDLPIKEGLTNNRNKVIFGPSGSGKSFFTNHLLNSYLKTGAHIVAVDVGDSYDRLCILNKGTYLTYDEKDPITFNPFFIKPENRSVEKKNSLLTLLFTLWQKDPDNFVDEYAILSECINSYYTFIDKGDLFMCFNTFLEFTRDVFFEELKEERKNLFDKASFFNVLGMFYKGGEYDYLLNSESNIDLLNEQFIVFELDNIKDHPILFPVVTLMIMDTFITKMRVLENTRKVILIEEAWKAISKAGMASFMKYLYKTVRKHFGEAILVTQEVDDIIGNEIIKDTIIKNCGAKILLDQREYANAFDDIQKLLSLNNRAKEQILSLNRNNIPGDKYKEVFIGLGNAGSVYGVNLSKEEYATYTTEKTEKEIVMKYYEKFKDMEMAIKLYADDLRNIA